MKLFDSCLSPPPPPTGARLSNPVPSSVLPHPQKETVGVPSANTQESVVSSVVASESGVVASESNVLAIYNSAFYPFGQI